MFTRKNKSIRELCDELFEKGVLDASKNNFSFSSSTEYHEAILSGIEHAKQTILLFNPYSYFTDEAYRALQVDYLKHRTQSAEKRGIEIRGIVPKQHKHLEHFLDFAKSDFVDETSFVLVDGDFYVTHLGKGFPDFKIGINQEIGDRLKAQFEVKEREYF